MDRKGAENYQVEDFVTDESFINYHFQLDMNDQLFWEAWLKEHPGNAGLAAEAEMVLETLSLKLPDHEFQEELEKIKKEIVYERFVVKNEPSSLVRLQQPTGIRHSEKNRKMNRRLFVIMPVLVILFIGGYFLYHELVASPSAFAVKVNNSSAPVVFTLSDNTIVTLAPQSNLRYPNKFDGQERKVYLEGEAQFHVKRDVEHPFKVYSGELVATVLGTIFKIKQQQGDSITEVELLTGKLKVEAVDSGSNTVQSILLDPEERVVYNSQDKKLTKETWQANAEPASTTNHLKFHRDNFESIARQLKAVFGVIVINESKQQNWLFTGEFNNSTAKEIVENICIIKKLKYEVQGDTIFIK